MFCLSAWDALRDRQRVPSLGPEVTHTMSGPYLLAEAVKVDRLGSETSYNEA